MPACRGSISALLLYDVAEEIDLKKLRGLIGAEIPLRSPEFRNPAPLYVKFEQAPVAEPCDAVSYTHLTLPTNREV